MTVDLREHIRWMVTLSPEEEGIPKQEVGNLQTNFAIMAAFTVAVERKLGDEPTLESIRRLVESIRGTYIDSENMPPVQAEAVIRAAYGEKELRSGIPLAELLRIQLDITYGTLQLLSLSKPEYEAYLDEATELAGELAARQKND